MVSTSFTKPPIISMERITTRHGWADCARGQAYFLFSFLAAWAVEESEKANRHRGSGHPLSPATPPGHAGPHPAVRRIKLRPYGHRRKSEPSKVGIGQSN